MLEVQGQLHETLSQLKRKAGKKGKEKREKHVLVCAQAEWLAGVCSSVRPSHLYPLIYAGGRKSARVWWATWSLAT